jgi:hypothetical protein
MPSALITHVYEYGVDVLEASIRAVGERHCSVDAATSNGREVRIRTWAAMLHGNFAASP